MKPLTWRRQLGFLAMITMTKVFSIQKNPKQYWITIPLEDSPHLSLFVPLSWHLSCLKTMSTIDFFVFGTRMTINHCVRRYKWSWQVMGSTRHSIMHENGKNWKRREKNCEHFPTNGSNIVEHSTLALACIKRLWMAFLLKIEPSWGESWQIFHPT